MEDMWRALHILEQKNNKMHQTFKRLQIGVPPASQNLGIAPNQQVFQLVPQSIREPKVNLLEKFDGTRSKF